MLKAMFGWKEKEKKKVIEIKILEKINYFSLFGFARNQKKIDNQDNIFLFGFRRKRKVK